MSELSAAQKKAFMEIPLMKEIKKNYMEAQKMSGAGKSRMRGGSWWNAIGNWFKQAAVDVDSWLKKTKALSTIGKVVGAIGMIPGLNEFAPVGAAVAKAGETLGYGRKKGGRAVAGRKGMTANDLAQHVNPVAGPRGRISQGMGTYSQNYQSPAHKMLGGTFPSHMTPFLRSRLVGGGAAQAVGSIGDATVVKF